MALILTATDTVLRQETDLGTEAGATPSQGGSDNGRGGQSYGVSPTAVQNTCGQHAHGWRARGAHVTTRNAVPGRHCGGGGGPAGSQD